MTPPVRTPGFPSASELSLVVAAALVLIALAMAVAAPLAAGALLVGTVAWCYFTVRFPLGGFFGSVLLQISLYDRLVVPLDASGGGIAVGDCLWIGLLAGMVLLSFPRGIPVPRNGRYGAEVWAIWPYLILATLLPVIGVIALSYPAAYALPGVRQLQWASYAPMAAFLCTRYGSDRVARFALRALVIAGVGHVIYGIVQFAFGMGWLSAIWITPDLIYNTQQGQVRFFYPRATGLLVNPNSLGAFSALVFAMILAFRPQRFLLVDRRLNTIATAVAILGLVLAGSRSALLGVLVLLAFLIVLSGFSRRVAAGGIVHVMALGLGLLAVLPLLRDYLPQIMVERFGRLFDIFRSGAEIDPTANARVVEWNMLWDMYLRDHILGTWVPPSYALNSPVDSFYVYSAIQGTPFLTIWWLVFMGGLASMGLRVYAREDLEDRRGFGLLLFLAAAVFLGTALGMSPMSETQMITYLWVMVGIAYHLKYHRERASARNGQDRVV